MEEDKVRLQPNTRITPGPGLYMVFGEGGKFSIGSTGPGDHWAHMLAMDPELECLVPLEEDTQGPYYRAHWPACVAFCHGKPAPLNKLLREGAGVSRWLPVPGSKAKPVIYGVMDAIARAPAVKAAKTDAARGYDITSLAAVGTGQTRFCKTLADLMADESVAGPLVECTWEGRNMLEHALRVRLFDAAQVLWDAGVRFSRSNMDDGLLFRDMANPAVASDLGVGFYCVENNLSITKDENGYEPSAGEVYCDLVELWLDRFAQQGGAWPTQEQRFAWHSGAKKRALHGDLLCIPMELKPYTFTVDGQLPANWPEWVRSKWEQAWGKAAIAYAPAAMINGVVESIEDGNQDKTSLGGWLRTNGHGSLAAALETKALRASTPGAAGAQAAPGARF